MHAHVTTLVATNPALPSTSNVVFAAPTNATLAIMNSNYPTLVHPYTKAVTGKDCIINVQAGVANFIGYGTGNLATDIANVESGLLTLYASAHTDGCKVIGETIIPYSPYGIGAGNAVLGPAAVNTWLRGRL